MRRIVERITQTGSDYVNSVLGTDWAQAADRWLRDVVDAKATAVSRAMDAEYLRTHIGGGWHRLFDGGHDLWGAFKATRTALPEDTILTQLGTFANELWKDMATPNGLPIFTLNKNDFSTVTHVLRENLNVPSGWVYDMATFTATELGGAVAAIAAILVNLRSTDPDRYFEMCGSLGVAALASANPVLLAVWLALVLKVAHTKKLSVRWRSSFAVLKGITTTTTIILSAAFLGLFGLILAIPLALLVRKFIDWLARGWSKQIGRGALNSLRTQMITQLSGPPTYPLISAAKSSFA